MPKSVDQVNQSTGGDAADRVFDALNAVVQRYRAQRRHGDDRVPGDLTHLEHKVLGFFARHPGATQSELALHSGRDKGQLARLVGALKERGLLEARADEGDRRQLRLHPTAAARSAYQASQRQARRLTAAALAGFSADEREQLAALLRRLHDNLEAASS